MRQDAARAPELVLEQWDALLARALVLARVLLPLASVLARVPGADRTKLAETEPS